MLTKKLFTIGDDDPAAGLLLLGLMVLFPPLFLPLFLLIILFCLLADAVSIISTLMHKTSKVMVKKHGEARERAEARKSQQNYQRYLAEQEQQRPQREAEERAARLRAREEAIQKAQATYEHEMRMASMFPDQDERETYIVGAQRRLRNRLIQLSGQ